MRWPEGVGVGARVIASTQMGFWLRGTVRRVDGAGASVVFDSEEAKDWLPRLHGFGAPHETVTPERIAPLPGSAPGVLPPLGSPVIVLWNGKRFHPATLIGRAHASAGVALYDEGDEEPVVPSEVLVRGTADEGATHALRQRGFVPGAPVRVVATGHAGWVSEVGSGVVYVRYPRASHGHWCSAGDLAIGGSARPPDKPTRSAARIEPGARVSARWVDRVHYPGSVRDVRAARGDVEIVWDDGSVEWVPAGRVLVTAAAPPAVPQTRSVEVIDVRAWTSGTSVLVRVASGDWTLGRVESVRGDDVYVGHGPAHRQGTWARGRELAAPPLGDRFPARGSAVVIEERARPNGPATHRTGRMGDAVGGRAEVRVDGSGTTMVGPEVLWRRVTSPTSPSAAPRDVSVGARVLVEHRPDDLVRGRVVKLRAPEGLARVELESGKGMTVDFARLHVVAEPAPPPPPAPPPIPPEPAAPPSADERARRIAKLVALEWTGGGYRASSGDGGRTSLEVEVGELTLDVRIENDDQFVVELTAAGAVEGAPPIEGTTVRFAKLLRSWIGGRADDVPVIEAEDRAWSMSLARPGVRRQVARAGGALSVVFRTEDEPTVAEVITWARAVHARLFA